MFKKYLLITLGWFFVALGVIGIFLPILPTTPFLLLAASCFARSSEKFHRWILNSPICGSIIQDWQQQRYIKKKVKAWAMTVVVITFSLSIYVVPLLIVKIFLIVMLCICLTIMYRLPTQPRSL